MLFIKKRREQYADGITGEDIKRECVSGKGNYYRQI